MGVVWTNGKVQEENERKGQKRERGREREREREREVEEEEGNTRCNEKRDSGKKRFQRRCHQTTACLTNRAPHNRTHHPVSPPRPALQEKNSFHAKTARAQSTNPTHQTMSCPRQPCYDPRFCLLLPQAPVRAVTAFGANCSGFGFGGFFCFFLSFLKNVDACCSSPIDCIHCSRGKAPLPVFFPPS
jgi:hypothetical protein